MRPTIALALLLIASACGAAETPAPEGRLLQLSRPQWKLYLPTTFTPREGGKIDLLVHFHGDPPTVWRNVEAARLNAVVVTANYNGLSSAYSTPFSDPQLFQTLLDEALAVARSLPGRDPGSAWDRVAVSSFSAGYGAVREVLKQPHYRETIDAVLAADSLYASTDGQDGTPVDEQMADYKAFADLAARGEKTFVLTHTEVPTPTYESTRDTADELLAHLGLGAEAVDLRGGGPLVFTRHAKRGKFTLWGSPGPTGEDHLAHLRYMAEWLDDLGLAATK